MGPIQQMMAKAPSDILEADLCGALYQILEVFLELRNSERGLDVDDNDKNHG